MHSGWKSSRKLPVRPFLMSEETPLCEAWELGPIVSLHFGSFASYACQECVKTILAPPVNGVSVPGITCA
jgi:hypothetical protein